MCRSLAHGQVDRDLVTKCWSEAAVEGRLIRYPQILFFPGLPSSAEMIHHFLQSYSCGGVINSVLIRHLFK